MCPFAIVGYVFSCAYVLKIAIVATRFFGKKALLLLTKSVKKCRNSISSDCTPYPVGVAPSRMLNSYLYSKNEPSEQLEVYLVFYPILYYQSVESIRLLSPGCFCEYDNQWPRSGEVLYYPSSDSGLNY
ncbi:MAG: hypothetical protein ACI8YQ_004295 [Polaribacter sp.]|jgi:hypothetical protein